MNRLFGPYRSVFAIQGSRALFAVALLTRIPGTAKGMLLTLHVVLDQHRGYGAAGVVAMALTLGFALGSPVAGRMVDRHGLRPVLVVTGVAESLYWVIAPSLSYPLLVGATFLGGLVSVPVFPVIRQAVAAHVPGGLRRQAFALDSMIVELAYMVGPAVAVIAVTGVHTATPSMYAIAALTLGAVVGMWPLGRILTRHPVPLGTDATDPRTQAPAKLPRGTWLNPGLILVLAMCTAANLTLSGTEVSVVASLRQHGETQWAGVTIIAWCAASLVGGFWHGSTARPRRLPVLMLLLGLGTIPVGIVGALGWQWTCLALVPAGFVCAPTIASTAEAISGAVPASARGQAMGLQAAALTLGGSLGAPLAGSVIDHFSAVWGFAVAGVIGTALAALALAHERFSGAHARSDGAAAVVASADVTASVQARAAVAASDDVSAASAPSPAAGAVAQAEAETQADPRICAKS
ncbi:MFS transporter [Streptacidiphilus jiangxiensis]|uniref:Predicted arabinose efflux permease, MFS family n=1 Tax=Streptacidiphilus jiangxiensis TaxID=235985 RepID=A0A1H7UVN8_STRJI|nr:MFS transporter [Streptacidiphilus jiangxiensis]SEM00527.1 Predicted arabinose efflux permease, MFS family [Streptacidiphilus jiangxiensis]